MRSLILLVPFMLASFACKKDKNAHPDGLNEHFRGEAYTQQNDLKADLTNMYLSFYDGSRFDFVVKSPNSNDEIRIEGNKFYTHGADSIFFYGIEVASSSLIQGYSYKFTGDSLVMIRKISAAHSKQIRLKRTR